MSQLFRFNYVPQNWSANIADVDVSFKKPRVRSKKAKTDLLWEIKEEMSKHETLYTDVEWVAHAKIPLTKCVMLFKGDTRYRLSVCVICSDSKSCCIEVLGWPSTAWDANETHSHVDGHPKTRFFTVCTNYRVWQTEIVH